MSAKVYDSNQVSMVMLGIPVLGGFADGEFCTIEQAEQDFMAVVGTDGEVTRSKSNNRMATIKIKLMQSSATNAAFSAINNLDVSTGGGAGVGPMLIADLQGTSLYAASKCWISKPPDVSFDRTATSREWEFTCADLKRLDGGN